MMIHVGLIVPILLTHLTQEHESKRRLSSDRC
jgi:hypothetical protein